MVQDHLHFTELLRACEPNLRREMYEAMRPHLRFPALPLDWYDMEAKARAEAAQLPLMDGSGLKPYMIPNIIVPDAEIRVTCRKCDKVCVFLGDRIADAIQEMRHAGWAWDELKHEHMCPECLEEVYALYEEAGPVVVERTIPVDPGTEGQDASGAPREPEIGPRKEGLPANET